MAGVQDSRLAIAVSQAGGLGALPCAMLTPQAMRTQISQLQQSGLPYNVNFFCHQPQNATTEQLTRWRDRLQPWYRQYAVDEEPKAANRAPFDEDAAQLLAEFKPPIVSFHFGLPSAKLMAQIKNNGSRVFSTATTVEEALWLAQNGADAIIAQGLEAGGHRGHFLSHDLSLQMGTMALLPQVVQALAPYKTKVIAAGGISHPSAVAAALQLGACAVQVGTAFLCSDEANTSAVHRAALQSPAARHTTLTTIFSGRPARGIVNNAIQTLGALPADVPPFPHASSAWGPIRSAAEAQGSGDVSPLWCGQSAHTCQSLPAAHIVQWLQSGLKTK